MPVLKELFAKSLRFEKKFNRDIDLNGGIKYFRKEFKSLKKGMKYFVAEEGEKIIGFVGGKIEEKSRFFKTRKIGAVYDLFVEEEYRGGGIGTELIKKFILWLKANKIKIIEIDVSPENKSAKKFYECLGFNEFGIQMRKKI